MIVHAYGAAGFTVCGKQTGGPISRHDGYDGPVLETTFFDEWVTCPECRNVDGGQPVMRTPVTPAGLERYDSAQPTHAAVLAWVVTGINPAAHTAAQQQVRDCMPVLARALDRAAAEYINDGGTL